MTTGSENRVTTRARGLNLNQRINRRSLLALGGSIVGTATLLPLLAACGGDDDDSADEPPLQATATVAPAAPTNESGDTADAATATSVPSTGDEDRGGTIVVGRGSDADTLDPTFSGSASASLVFINIYDPLIGYNMDHEFEPVLCESWEISDDGLQYTWSLREGITFHDGTEFNADAVKFVFDRIIDPATGATNATDVEPLTEIEVIDQFAVRFHLESPLSPILGTLATEFYGIPSPTAIQEHGDAFGQNPVGTGPFKFEEWVVDDHITLVPNENYNNVYSYTENTGAPYIDELVIRVLPEEQTQVAALETGDINLLRLPAQHIDRFKGDDDFVVHTSDGANVWYIDFNLTKSDAGIAYGPPFEDLRTRQAVAYAVNAQEIIDGLLDGYAIRNQSPLPANNFATQLDMGDAGYDYDPERAKQLLDDAGWVEGSDGVREKDGEALHVVLWTFTSTTSDRISQLIQNQLQQVGFDVTFESLEGGAFSEGIGTDRWDLYFTGLAWSEPDILHWLTHRERPGLGVYAEYKPELGEVLDEARTVSDLDERAELYDEACEMLLADAAVVPLYSVSEISASRSEVRDLKIGPRSEWIYQDAWVASD